MSDWPEGWTRRQEAARDEGDPEPARTGVLGPFPAGPRTPARDRREDSADGAARGGERTGLTPAYRPRDPDAGRLLPPPAAPPAPPRRRRTGRRVVLAVLVAVALLLVLVLGLVLWAFGQVDKVDALRDYAGRPAAAPGQDYLLVGSDSREGLSAEQRSRLKTGSAAGRRTDTIVLLHVPSGGGKPTMVSLPRDSYVPIPGRGRNKLNAAYALGGPALLVRTVEQATGIRIDHYSEIGFGGFVSVTDAVDGVTLCPQRDIKDPKAGLDVRKGCQPMDGPTALGYVRARYSDPKGDLGRVERQQEFLGAVFEKATSPGTLLNPVRLLRVADAGSQALTVDEDDGVLDMVRFGMAMRRVAGGDAVKTTVPVANPNLSTDVGSAVLWDRDEARALFARLRSR